MRLIFFIKDTIIIGSHFTMRNNSIFVSIYPQKIRTILKIEKYFTELVFLKGNVPFWDSFYYLITNYTHKIHSIEARKVFLGNKTPPPTSWRLYTFLFFFLLRQTTCPQFNILFVCVYFLRPYIGINKWLNEP